MLLTTTFKELKELGACEEGYRKLAKYLGGSTKYGKEKTINVLDILDSNGVDDCLWVVGRVADKKTRLLLGADLAESVLHIYEEQYPDDPRVRDCIRAIRDNANGLITDAAWAAAGAAAGAAARDAARDAAGAAAGAAAWAAARDAAGAAAWAAARDAAGAAAGDAAGAAAWDAAGAAARAAAWAAEREKQAHIIREHFHYPEQIAV